MLRLPAPLYHPFHCWVLKESPLSNHPFHCWVLKEGDGLGQGWPFLMTFNQNQGPGAGAQDSSLPTLKGGSGPCGGFADTSEGVGIFSCALYITPFCSGFLCHSKPFPAGRRFILRVRKGLSGPGKPPFFNLRTKSVIPGMLPVYTYPGGVHTQVVYTAWYREGTY